MEIILVPSQKDGCLEWAAFPQPPIGSAFTPQEESAQLHRLGLINSDGETMVHLFPNPVQFTINEMVIAVANTDIITDIFKVQLNRKKNRFEHCFKHILDQRHFYPLFPPAVGACLDSTRALGSSTNDPCVLQVAPDILILPSKMTHKICAVEETLCINPGVLCKGRGGGTFCRVAVHSMDENTFSESDAFGNQVSTRSRAEVIKL